MIITYIQNKNSVYTNSKHEREHKIFLYLYESGVAINHKAISSCFSADIGFLPIAVPVAFSAGPINVKIISNVAGNTLERRLCYNISKMK